MTQANETRQQAATRQHNELSRDHANILSVHSVLANGDTALATEVFGMIRAGYSSEEIMEHTRASLSFSRATDLSPERRKASRDLLILLALSTLPLAEVVDMAGKIMHSRLRLTVPRHQDPIHPDSIITRVRIVDMLAHAGVIQERLPSPTQVQLRLDGPDGTDDGPPFWVPASPGRPFSRTTLPCLT